MNLAGQPSRAGGIVARVAGWMVLAAGWLVAALFAGLIVLLGGDWAALIVGGPIALISSVAAYALLRGGKELKRSGDDTEQATKNQAVFALANTHGGVLHAWDVAQALQIAPSEGDQILTKLAKEQPDHVSVDVDDDGNVLYRFHAAAQSRSSFVEPARAPAEDLQRAWAPTRSGVVPNAPTMAPNAVPPHVRVNVTPQQQVASRSPRGHVEEAEPLEELEPIEPTSRRAR